MGKAVIKDFDDPAFPHGTTLGRSRGCKCQPCRHAHNVRNKVNKVRRERVKNGQGDGCFQPVAPVAAHLTELVSLGVSVKRITELTGIDNRTLRNIRNQKFRTVKTPLAKKILAVTSDHIDKANPELVIAKIEVLRNLGYDMRWLSLACGKGQEYISYIASEAKTRPVMTKSHSGAAVLARLTQIETLTKMGYMVPVKGKGVRTADLNAKAS